ncbi:MAG TPA: hypothetical protein ENK52_03705 [Saprospiraceae bacterium]|nr:hypothetical protein [Saprospiraceae bacterium]
MKSRFIILFLLVNSLLYAQEERSNEGGVLLFNFSYAFQIPGGDLADRFGHNVNIGGGIHFMTKKDWIIGLKGNVLFSQNVKEDVLAGIRNSSGFLIGINKAFALVSLRERGFYAGGLLGKIWRLGKAETRSGIRTTIGIGLLQHKIRLQDDSNTANQIFGDYAKGYDRLTNGLALNEFIGYHLLAKNRGMNFFAGFDFTQAFTQSRRDVNFDTMQKDETKRVDLLFGFRVGATLSFYVGEPTELILY